MAFKTPHTWESADIRVYQKDKGYFYPTPRKGLISRFEGDECGKSTFCTVGSLGFQCPEAWFKGMQELLPESECKND